MKTFSASTRPPAAIWYFAGLGAGTYYALFYSQSPRLWGFVLTYWLLVGAFLYCYSKVQPTDILSPIFGLVALLFLYSFASAVFVEQFGVISSGEAVSDSVITVYYFSCLAGLSGLMIGALFGSHSLQPVHLQRKERALAHGLPPNRAFSSRLIFWAMLLGILFVTALIPQFNFFHVAAYSERAFALRVERAAVASSGLREVFFSRLPATYVLCAATLVVFGFRSRPPRLLGLSIFLAYVATNTLAGWRGVVVAALLIPVVYYHYRIKPLSVRFALISGVFIYLFVNALSLVRVSSKPGEMFELLRENIGANGLAFASLSSSGELLVGTNLMRLISGIEAGETHFTYGQSVTDGLLALAPRSIYPNRPLSLGERFADVFYPGLLERGGGRGLFILQDGYWAFGIPGVFIFMLVYGWAVQRVYLWFMKNLRNDLVVLCYSAIYGALVMGAVRSGIVSSFKGAIIAAIPFAILAVLVKVRLPAGVPRQMESREPLKAS